ncbi:MAG: DmsE family decaheme c-type cytochrome [Pseudomonadota bacterium]
MRLKVILCALLSVQIVFLTGIFTADASSAIGSEESCKDCHSDQYNSYAKTIHARMEISESPANKKACESCHGMGDKHVEQGGGDKAGMLSFGKEEDAQEKSGKCLACHEESQHLAFWDNGKHKSSGVSCDACHLIHGGGRDKALKDSQQEICFGCHNNIRMLSNRQSHHPVKEGKMTCTDCHNPHGSFDAQMLQADSANDLCFKCHAEKRGPFRFEHQPVTENCLSCHNVHGSNHSAMLTRRPPQLCQECHGAGGHRGRTYTDERSFNGPDPRMQMYGRACMNCHTNIHGSSAEFLR